MISGKLKNILYSRKIRKVLDKKAPSFKTVSGRAGLIIDAEDFDDKWKLARFYRLAGISKENFRVIVCSSEENLPEIPGASILFPGEVSLRGEFRARAIRDFAEEDLDFILCYCSKSISTACLLAAVSRAALKIGNSPDEYGIYDVEIGTTDIEVFQQEALKYLKILKNE